MMFKYDFPTVKNEIRTEIQEKLRKTTKSGFGCLQ